MASLPIRFLTPFSFRPSRLLPNSLLLGEGQWLKKPFEGKAGMVPLQDGERAKPETELALARWGKDSVFLRPLG